MASVTNREMSITQWVASPIHSDKQDGADSNQGKKRRGGLESWTEEPRKVVMSTWLAINHFSSVPGIIWSQTRFVWLYYTYLDGRAQKSN